jgi:hypothetical protein
VVKALPQNIQRVGGIPQDEICVVEEKGNGVVSFHLGLSRPDNSGRPVRDDNKVAIIEFQMGWAR